MPTPQYCCGVGRWQIGSMANSLSLRVNAHCVMLESKALANFSHFDPHCCFFTSAAFASHIPMFHWFKYVQVQVQQIATILRILFVFVCSSKHPCIIYYDHLYIYTYIYRYIFIYIYIWLFSYHPLQKNSNYVPILSGIAISPWQRSPEEVGRLGGVKTWKPGQFGLSSLTLGVFHKWGYPNSWLIYFMEKPSKKWMR